MSDLSAEPAGRAASPRPGPHATRRRRWYLAAMVVDAIGSGLWLPFGLIFFVAAQHLPVAQVGLALTAGGLIGQLAAPLGGSMTDRYGAPAVIVLSNVLRVATFATYPVVGSAWQVALLAAVTAGADRLFWIANTPMLASVAPGRRLERLLAAQNVIRITGLGLGAAVASVLAASVRGLHLIAYLNAGTFALAAALVLASGVGVATARSRAAGPAGVQPEAAGGDGRSAWSSVLGDRPYAVLCLVQVIFALAASSLVVILPLASVDPLPGPHWLPGASVVVGNVVLVLAQHPVVRAARRYGRLAPLSAASVVFAAAFVLLSAGLVIPPAVVVPLVLAGAAIGVVGEALAMPLMTAAADQAAPERLRGRYSAMFQTGWGLATVVAPALFTGLLSLGYAVLWLALAVLVLAAIPLLVWVAPRLPGGCLIGAADTGSGGAPGATAGDSRPHPAPTGEAPWPVTDP